MNLCWERKSNSSKEEQLGSVPVSQETYVDIREINILDALIGIRK